MHETAAVADGTVVARAECEGMSATTFQSTRLHEARYIVDPDATGEPEPEAEPVKLIQIGPTDV